MLIANNRGGRWAGEVHGPDSSEAERERLARTGHGGEGATGQRRPGSAPLAPRAVPGASPQVPLSARHPAACLTVSMVPFICSPIPSMLAEDREAQAFFTFID